MFQERKIGFLSILLSSHQQAPFQPLADLNPFELCFYRWLISIALIWDVLMCKNSEVIKECKNT